MSVIKMDRKILSLVLLVGMGVLTCGGQFDGGGSSVPEGCDMTADNRCFRPFMSSGVLNKFLNEVRLMEGEMSSTDTSQGLRPDTILDLSRWEAVCNAFDVSMYCLRLAEYKCFEDKQLKFKDLLQLQFDVPRVFELRPIWESFCTEKMKCLSRLAPCHKEQLFKNQIDYRNPADCRAMTKFQNCVIDVLNEDGKCRADPEIQQITNVTNIFIGYCEEYRCPEILRCIVLFVAAEPTESGVDGRTCYIYADYVQCVAKAVSSCPNVSAFPPGQARRILTRVADLFRQACDAIEPEGLKMIYDCLSFNQCIARVTDIDLFNSDTTYLPNICPMSQDVAGCAADAVRKCDGVDESKKQAFEVTMTRIAYEAQRSGCGKANVFADACMELQVCKQTYLLSPINNFDDMCTKAAMYQACASPAVQHCTRTSDPDTLEAVSVETPHLGNLSRVTEKLCKVTKGLCLTDCAEFEECMWNLTVRAPVEPGWALMNGEAWCLYNLRMMMCANGFSRTCSVPPSVREQMWDVYDDLRRAGCKDPFFYGTSREASAGALPLVSVSLVALMLLVSLKPL